MTSRQARWQRQKDAELRAAGFVSRRLWVYPEVADELRQCAERLNRKAEKRRASKSPAD